MTVNPCLFAALPAPGCPRRLARVTTTALMLGAAMAVAVGASGCSSSPGTPASRTDAPSGRPIDGAAPADGAGGGEPDTRASEPQPLLDAGLAPDATAMPSSDAAADAAAAAGPGPDGGGKLASRSVGYVRSSLGNLPALATSGKLREMSHIILAFANPTASEPLALSGGDADVAALLSAAHSAGVKVLVAIGGASGTSAVLPQLVPAKVQAFVQAAVAFADGHGLDGVDIDLEDDAMPPANYEALVKGLSDALRPKGKLVTAAVASWFDSQITPAALALMDFVSVMAYDDCDGSSPSPCQHASYDSAVKELDHFLKARKLPPDKVVLGVPFYGYCWGAGCGTSTLNYADIATRFPAADAADFVDTAEAKVYYNGPATIARKAKLGRTNGGVMFWHLAADAPAPHSLLDVIASALEE
jgi:chitinase